MINSIFNICLVEYNKRFKIRRNNGTHKSSPYQINFKHSSWKLMTGALFYINLLACTSFPQQTLSSDSWSYSAERVASSHSSSSRFYRRKTPASLQPWKLCCWPLLSSPGCLAFQRPNLFLTLPSARHSGKTSSSGHYSYLLHFFLEMLYIHHSESWKDSRGEFLMQLSPFRLFGTPCAKIGSALVQQIQTFDPMNGCAECLYTVRTSRLRKWR